VTSSPDDPSPAEIQATIQAFVDGAEIAYERPSDDLFVLTLPGEHKLRTTVALTVGTQSVTVNAFVARNPDEGHEAVYRWLLERNRRMYAVTFAIDQLGDIYLVGHLPLHAVDADELDRVIGAVLEYADGSFNTILELGFVTAIRKEWAWRRSRGESTQNLEAFAHLAEPQSPEEQSG
jgi:hypothetical protein